MLCARRRSFQAEGENSPQIMADLIKFRGARPLKGGVQPSQGSGVPSDLGYQANPLEVKGPLGGLCPAHQDSINVASPHPAPRLGVPLRCALLKCEKHQVWLWAQASWWGASSISMRKVSMGVSPMSLKKNRCSRHLRPMDLRAGRRSSSLANRPCCSGYFCLQ